MTLSANLETAINEQIASEFYAAYTYLGMSAWCEDANLPGFASWLRGQSEEEVGHAMKLFQFLQDRGVRPQLRAIEQPRSDYASALEVARAALDHERKVSQAINKLYGLAVDAKDYATQAQLQWFVTEQVEEEKTAQEIVAMLERAEPHPGALYMVDRDLAARRRQG